jgi:DNA repair ATPase RecN
MSITKKQLKSWAAALSEAEPKVQDVFDELSGELEEMPDDTERQQEKRERWELVSEHLEQAVDSIQCAIAEMNE